MQIEITQNAVLGSSIGDSVLYYVIYAQNNGGAGPGPRMLPGNTAVGVGAAISYNGVVTSDIKHHLVSLIAT